MRVDEPVRQVTSPAGDPAWQVTGYERVKVLLGDPRLGRSHPDPQRAARYSESAIFGQASGLPFDDDVGHTWMRKLLAPAFAARRIDQLRPRVRELAGLLVDELVTSGAPADFHELISFPLPALVICDLLGVPYEDRDDFRRWSDEAADMTDGERSRVGLARLRAYMAILLERKRRHPAEDVISDLARWQDQLQGAFQDEHVATLAAGLLFAGHETTVAVIDRGAALLLSNPKERDTLERDPDLVPVAVEEILRSPEPDGSQPDGHRALGVVPRWAKADIELEGVTIPAGDLVLLLLGDANLDERIFPAPLAFDVSRTPNPHLTFGHGPYFCIGAPLARVELQTLFGMLFQRLPGLRLAVPLESLPRRSGHLTSGFAALPVAW